MCILLFLTVATSLLVGTAHVSPGELWDVITGAADELSTAGLIVLNIRLPRILLAGLVGLALSVGGLVFQALLRNPLADPFILGVSSGGAFGAVLGILCGLSFSLGIPLFAFAGALVLGEAFSARFNSGMTGVLAIALSEGFFTPN